MLFCQQEASVPTTDTPPTSDSQPTTGDFDNCEQLDLSLTLSWTVDRDSESVKFMLCGCISDDSAS